MRRDKALIFPWEKKKEKQTNIFLFLPCFLDLISAEISLTMWTVSVLSSRLHRQAVITTVPAHNFPRLQAGNKQSHHPEPHGKQSIEQKTPLLLLKEDWRVWHQSYRSEKITLIQGEKGWKRCGCTEQLPSLKSAESKWQILRRPSGRQRAFHFSNCPEGGKEQNRNA